MAYKLLLTYAILYHFCSAMHGLKRIFTKEMVIQLILSEILIVELVIMLLRPLGSFFQDPHKMLTNHIIRSQTLAF